MQSGGARVDAPSPSLPLPSLTVSMLSKMGEWNRNPRRRHDQVVLNWFWGDVQRELSVGGGVVQPARTWGLHAACLLVKGLEAESNPTQYSEVQEMVKYLGGVVELLEAHFLGAWTLPDGGQHLSKRELI